MSIKEEIDSILVEVITDFKFHNAGLSDRLKYRDQIISYLKSQGWKSPEDCRKCLEGLDVLMKPLENPYPKHIPSKDSAGRKWSVTNSRWLAFERCRQDILSKLREMTEKKERHDWHWNKPSVGQRQCSKCGKVSTIRSHSTLGGCMK